MAASQNADPARRAAVLAVVRVHRGGWANLTAKSVLADSSLQARDKAFANLLFYGTIERLVTLDYLLAPLLKRPLEKLDVEVRSILETGLYQMLYMNVPSSAAVNESVKLARSMGKSSASGFVNAVLRRADKAGCIPDVFDTELERVCITWSASRAVAEAVMQALPHEYDAFFEASFARPALCLRTNTLKITPEDLAQKLTEKGAEVWQGQLHGALYAKMPGGVMDDELFQQGFYHVQGEASQYACACVDARPGHRVLDMCAAPGGKSATLAQYMGAPVNQGTLTACDVRENRLPLVKETLARLGIEGANLLLNDASEYSPALAEQDRVLCDVPCSGLGVIAKKPDIRYTDGDNFNTLPALQGAILATGARYVKRGGRLVYSTCTIRKEENEQIVSAFLASQSGFRLVEPYAPPKGANVQQNMVTILPHNTDLDGFFVATLERV